MRNDRAASAAASAISSQTGAGFGEMPSVRPKAWPTRWSRFRRLFLPSTSTAATDAEGFDLGCGSGRWAPASRRRSDPALHRPSDKALASHDRPVDRRTVTFHSRIPTQSRGRRARTWLAGCHSSHYRTLEAMRCCSPLRQGRVPALHLLASTIGPAGIVRCDVTNPFGRA